MDKPATNATDLQLEKIALGEAKPEGPLSKEDEARLAALRQDNAQILARYPAGPQAQQIAARVAAAQKLTQKRAQSRWLLAPGVLGAAATLVAVLWFTRSPHVGPDGPEGPEGPDVILTKGGAPRGAAKLLLYRSRDGHTEPLSDGAAASPGDLLQLALVPGKARFGVLVSIDGRGGVTLHHPSAPAESPSLFAGSAAPSPGEAGKIVTGEIRLPQAFRLDDAPGFERFFLITAEGAGREALSIDQVVAQARSLAADRARAEREPIPGLPSGLAQTSLILRKPETGGGR